MTIYKIVFSLYFKFSAEFFLNKKDADERIKTIAEKDHYVLSRNGWYQINEFTPEPDRYPHFVENWDGQLIQHAVGMNVNEFTCVGTRAGTPSEKAYELHFWACEDDWFEYYFQEDLANEKLQTFAKEFNYELQPNGEYWKDKTRYNGVKLNEIQLI